MIDFHAHMGTLYRDDYPQVVRLTASGLVSRMDQEGIDISVVLPLESPEGGWGWSFTEEVVHARNEYPTRIVAFCCVDPRDPKGPQLIDHFVTKHDCRGFGEHVNGLAFDDPLNKALYAKCNDHGLPLVFGDDLECFDLPGLPRLEACLKEFPDVKFCGHGPGFWSAISGDDPRTGYPTRPVTPGGALDRLLDEYENLHLDLSAGSGYNALTRDPEFTLGFIERHWRRMLWGTDITHALADLPQIEWIKTIDIAEDVRQAIADGNARKLLGL